jgi:MSHA biogenesis protein MshL
MATGGSNSLQATAGYALGAAANAANSIFGLAFQTSNFAALISFLESQGNVNVLSSPRISTVNNQKAVLKVGTDEFFVTNVSSTTTTGTATTTTPNVTLQPFFSGVVLDVTPQIDDRGNIILHIHPSVSQVNTVNKAINLGSGGGSLNLPLASSNTSETDSIVRGQDGQIIAIGGLMQTSVSVDKSQVPGAGDVPVLGALFKSKNQTMQKRELVILLKPTIVQGQGTWNNDMLDTQRRMQDMDARPNGAR